MEWASSVHPLRVGVVRTFRSPVDAQSPHGLDRAERGTPIRGQHTVLVNGETAGKHLFVASARHRRLDPGAETTSDSPEFSRRADVQRADAHVAEAPRAVDICSDEERHLFISGTKRVRYRKQGKYNYGLFPGAWALATSAAVVHRFRYRRREVLQDSMRVYTVSPPRTRSASSAGQQCARRSQTGSGTRRRPPAASML